MSKIIHEDVLYMSVSLRSCKKLQFLGRNKERIYEIYNKKIQYSTGLAIASHFG